MTFDYTKIAASSLRMLTKFGRDVTRRSYTAGAYNPATGATINTTADTTRKGVLLDLGVGTQYNRGLLVQLSDKRLLLDVSDSISLQDHVIVGGIDYSIVSLGEVNPAGTKVLYDLHLRVG